jgi:hypothetical protein
LAFQFDQTTADFDELMGREMTVTIGNVSDRHLNKMDENAPPIKFTKTLANLNLDEASARFLITVDDDNCANGLSLDDETLQSEIANILALPEPSRIEIVTSVCNEIDTTVGATVMIRPPADSSVRRSLSKRNHHAVALVYSLLETTSLLEDGTQRRALANGREFHIGPMQIIPGPTDAKLLETDPDVKLKEERIRAGRWDENEELQHKQMLSMLRMEENVEGNMLRMEENVEGNMLRMEDKNQNNIDSVLEELRLERQEIRALGVALGRQESRALELVLCGVIVGLLLFALAARMV